MEQNIYNAIYKVNHAGGCGSCFYLKQYDLFVTNLLLSGKTFSNKTN